MRFEITMPNIFTLILILVITLDGSAQVAPPKEFMLPSSFQKTKAWLIEDKQREGLTVDGDTIFIGYEGKAPDKMTISDCIKVIKSEKNFGTFLDAKSWAIKNYLVAFPYLVQMLTDTTLVGLTNTADLIIPGRDLPFYGHGGILKADLFTVAGRASFILNDLTGEGFASVYPGTTMPELKRFQVQWVEWIRKLKK